MKVNYCARFTMLLLVTTLMVLCGCLGRSQPTRFYLLRPTLSLQTREMLSPKEGLRIGVGPISLPEYLDRPQIVTRIGESELLIDEFNQWAESLTFSFERILAENLSILLFTDNLYVFPWLGSTQIDYQVKVDIIRFNGIPAGKAILETQYTIFEGGSREILERNVSTYNRPTDVQNYESLALSMSQVLEDLSREIAQTIRALPKKDKPLEPKE
jgi:uncharacterized lipoprotein YmbA